MKDKPQQTWNEQLQRYHTPKEQLQNREQELKENWRLLCDNKIISSCKPSSTDKEFAQRMCQLFQHNIINAHNHIDNGTPWEWNGDGGTMTAQEWLEHHSNRLGMKITTNLKIIPPGDQHPMCPNWWNII